MSTENLSKVLDEKIEILMTCIKKVHFVTLRQESEEALLAAIDEIKRLQKAKLKSDVRFLSLYESYLKEKAVSRVDELSSQDQDDFKGIQGQITKIDDLEQILHELTPTYDQRVKEISRKANEINRINRASLAYNQQNKLKK